MRLRHICSAILALAVSSTSALFAADNVSGAMKKILDSRKDDFAAIRTSPHDVSDGTAYMSTVLVPGAKECYIQPEEKPHYSDSCDVIESHNRSAVMAKYASYMKALKEVSPSSWTTWSEKKAKPNGEETFIGPDHEHPAASIRWVVEGMNADYYLLSVTFYGEGYTHR